MFDHDFDWFDWGRPLLFRQRIAEQWVLEEYGMDEMDGYVQGDPPTWDLTHSCRCVIVKSRNVRQMAIQNKNVPGV